MALKAYYWSSAGRIQSGLGEDESKTALQDKQGTLWVDVCEMNETEAEFLAQTFGFHSLAIEDCAAQVIHSPKIDDFGDHLFIVVHGVNYSSESDIVETAELRLFLGSNFVVSSHNVFMYSIDFIAKLVEVDGRPMRRGADFFAYILIDTLINNVTPTIDKMDDVADGIEEEVIHNPHQSTLAAIMKLKRSTQRLRRVMGPQREVMNRLSRREFSLIHDDTYIFFRDIYDGIVRIEDICQSLRDRADNALATHLSSVANRQNENMRILSTVATIFLPLALVAGIYGMNFEYMPELGWHWGYFAVIGFIGVMIVAVISWFWARKWLAWSRRQFARARIFTVEPEKLVGYFEQMRKWPRL